MIKKKLSVLNELGLHARVASSLARTAKRFDSSIYICKDDTQFDLKSPMCIIMSNVKGGDEVDVVFEGEDEKNAEQAITILFAEKFHER